MRRLQKAVLVLAALGLTLAPTVPAHALTLVRALGLACSTTNRFSPSSVSVAKGATVVWKSSCNKHSVTAYGGNWSKNVTITKGQTTSRKFTSNGTFRYRCTFHSSLRGGTCVGMCGQVKVG